jgi:D-psicose/D-tagatose/L-ribulose 3-epimerase
MNDRPARQKGDSMKFGIYYAYWEQEWVGDFKRYIEKVAKLGFDILEIAAHQITTYSDRQIEEIRAASKANGIILTAGIGPTADRNLSSADPAVRERGRKFFTETLTQIARLDVKSIGGALHSYWPVDYSKPVDKPGDWQRGVEGIRDISKVAADLGITLCIEVLNRFENYVLNTAAEGVAFVKQVGRPNVKVMLDTFHMNIEEDSIGGAIRTAGPLLGHLHTGECNRRVPGRGRMPWREIGEALRDIGYDGNVVMEPFVRTGGAVGGDIRVWRDLSDKADEDKLDREAMESLRFSRFVLAG